MAQQKALDWMLSLHDNVLPKFVSSAADQDLVWQQFPYSF
jgi:hypothetical protein